MNFNVKLQNTLTHFYKVILKKYKNHRNDIVYIQRDAISTSQLNKTIQKCGIV